MNELSSKIENISDQKQIESLLHKTDLQSLHSLKLYLDDLYYNTGDSVIEDWKYDLIKEIIQKRDPNYVPPVGAELRKGENRVSLPYWLGSADKYTPEETPAFERWLDKNKAPQYMVSDKLDGVSCLLSCVNGRVKLFTRGNGKIGADISYLTKYFKTIPKLTNETINVRGELIIKKKVFEQKYRDQSVNGRVYKNSRNMVSGLIGAKTVRVGLSDIDFVVYEIVGDSMPKPSEQFKKLKQLGFKVANHKLLKKINLTLLSDTYLKFKKESEYEIDGIIVQSDVPYDRNISGNPDYMFAFKMRTSDNLYKTTVQDIEWNISKWGLLKPVVIVDKVELGDITISRATGHNAKYIIDNNIGPGSIITITRSKDVIPYIVDVVKSTKPKLPDIKWKWDKNKVNAVVVNYDSIMCVKLISSFFSKLGIKHVSEATVNKLYENGFNTLLKILGASKKQLSTIPGFKEGMVNRTYDNIHNGLKNVSLPLLLGSSGIFGDGMGRKRMDMLLLDIPNLLTVYKTVPKQEMMEKILNVEGFSEIMAKKIYKNLKWADLFMIKMAKYVIIKKDKRVSDSLKGKKFVMSGFRDKNLENDIKERGGKTVSSISKNTTALIVPDKNGKVTGKIEKAQKLGITIYSKDDFISKFL